MDFSDFETAFFDEGDTMSDTFELEHIAKKADVERDGPRWIRRALSRFSSKAPREHGK